MSLIFLHQTSVVENVCWLLVYIGEKREVSYTIYRLMHALFHIRTVIIPRDRYRPEGFSPRGDIGRGMITVLIWKKACINLFITYFKIEFTYFNIELKRTKSTWHTHTHTKLWVIDISWRMITVQIWKQACIVLFIKRLDIMLFYS